MLRRVAAAPARVLPGEMPREFRCADRDPAAVEAGADLPATIVPAVEVVVPVEEAGVARDHVDADVLVKRDLGAAMMVQLVAIAVRGGVGRRAMPGTEAVRGGAVAAPVVVAVDAGREQGDRTDQEEEREDAPRGDSGTHGILPGRFPDLIGERASRPEASSSAMGRV